MKRVLFVCHGNICRSVMAEYIFKNLDKKGDFYVESAATTREEIGNDIYPPIKEVLSKHNIKFDSHRARQVNATDYDLFDYIICMDQENLDDLKRILPYSDKTFLLNETEIDDPWYSREFESCFQEIYQGCEKLFNTLQI